MGKDKSKVDCGCRGRGLQYQWDGQRRSHFSQDSKGARVGGGGRGWEERFGEKQRDSGSILKTEPRDLPLDWMWGGRELEGSKFVDWTTGRMSYPLGGYRAEDVLLRFGG